MAAREFAPGVRVNGLAPGFALLPEGASDDYAAELLNRIPLGRASGPEELCDALLFLERSPGITGQILYIDGGWHL
jgi:NAD(P)-dependent dehydrogenase (short-subunit alcohol dehydrogenase family)